MRLYLRHISGSGAGSLSDDSQNRPGSNPQRIGPFGTDMVRELQCKTKEKRIKLMLYFNWVCKNKWRLKTGCSYWVLNRLHTQITQDWIQITSAYVNTKLCRASFAILKSNIFLSYIRSKTAHLNTGFCIVMLNAHILPLPKERQVPTKVYFTTPHIGFHRHSPAALGTPQ